MDLSDPTVKNTTYQFRFNSPHLTAISRSSYLPPSVQLSRSSMYSWQAVSRREISVQPPVNLSPFVSCSPNGLTKGRHSSSQWKTVVRKLLGTVDERGSRDLGQPARTSAPHGSRPGAAAAQRDETLHLGYGERLRGLEEGCGARERDT